MEIENLKIVNDYADDIISGKVPACKELIQTCNRYKSDLKSGKYDFRPEEAEEIIRLIEDYIVFLDGEAKDGSPFNGLPFLLQSWQKFIIFNLCGFFDKGTNIRRFTEALLFLPKKNGKTPFAGALAWAFGIKHSSSSSKVLLTSVTLMQALFPFTFIKKNLEKMGLLEPGQKRPKDGWRIRDNNMEHSIEGIVGNGEIHIQAFSGEPKDGLKANFVIADEIHEYKNADQYLYYQKAMKNYRNKLMLAITTAGDDTTSFCYQRLKTCQKILDGTIKNDEYFIFITKADQDADGNADYLNPTEHQKANPNYNVTVMDYDLLKAANEAKEEPQLMKSFLAKELNIYTASVKAYFDLEVFIKSNAKYKWTMEELAKLPINWYGGVDLSKMHDLTAAALYGEYKGVDIIIPHCWFPITQAINKAEKDNIPIFGWQDDGWLTMCNAETVHYDDVVKWFVEMRKKGFKIKEVRYDIRFGDQFYSDMRKEKFKIENQPQLYTKTTQGFNRIHYKSLEGHLYYCSAEPFEYCVQNVKANEKTGGFMEFGKIKEEQRIDIFSAAVFATVGMLESSSGTAKASRLFSDNRKKEELK